MPKGVFVRKKKQQPADGGSVQAPEVVKPQVRAMAGYSSIDELKDALPESTAASPDSVETPRKKRRTKEEMAASRGVTIDSADLMSDPLYREAVQRFIGFGAPKLIKKPLKFMALGMQNPDLDLTRDEEKDIDAYSYIVSKRMNADPFQSTLTTILTGIFMLFGLAFTRIWILYQDTLTAQLSELFGFDILKDKKLKDEAKRAQAEVLEEMNG